MGKAKQSSWSSNYQRRVNFILELSKSSIQSSNFTFERVNSVPRLDLLPCHLFTTSSSISSSLCRPKNSPMSKQHSQYRPHLSSCHASSQRFLLLRANSSRNKIASSRLSSFSTDAASCCLLSPPSNKRGSTTNQQLHHVVLPSPIGTQPNRSCAPPRIDSISSPSPIAFVGKSNQHVLDGRYIPFLTVNLSK